MSTKGRQCTWLQSSSMARVWMRSETLHSSFAFLTQHLAHPMNALDQMVWTQMTYIPSLFWGPLHHERNQVEVSLPSLYTHSLFTPTAMMTAICPYPQLLGKGLARPPNCGQRGFSVCCDICCDVRWVLHRELRACCETAAIAPF